MKMKRPSWKTRRALRILDENPGILPGGFARKMWDTSGWVTNAIGKTGGAYMDRLRVYEMIDNFNRLTEEGRRVLTVRKDQGDAD